MFTYISFVRECTPINKPEELMAKHNKLVWSTNTLRYISVLFQHICSTVVTVPGYSQGSHPKCNQIFQSSSYRVKLHNFKSAYDMTKVAKITLK